MGIADWPQDERPREKLLLHGAERLSDAELLAVFLRTGVAGYSAIDLARQMLLHFGGLRATLEASLEQFSQLNGLGPAKYAVFQAALEMCRRHLSEEMVRGNVFDSPQTTRNFLSTKLRHLPHEVFACLFLDSQHALIRFEELFQGTINAAAVYPREVVRKALDYRAAAVILAHNHPSGVAEPSSADRAITDRLKAALGLVDIAVLDHLVVGDVDVVSFAERGWV